MGALPCTTFQSVSGNVIIGGFEKKQGFRHFSLGGLRCNDFYRSSSCEKGDILSKGQRVPLLKQRSSSSHQRHQKVVIAGKYPQNVDLPADLPQTKKKPFPIPVKELRRAARERQKNKKGRPRRPIGPPRNGLLVPELIPVAHEVFEARTQLVNGVAELLKVVPVHACR